MSFLNLKTFLDFTQIKAEDSNDKFYQLTGQGAQIFLMHKGVRVLTTPSSSIYSHILSFTDAVPAHQTLYLHVSLTVWLLHLSASAYLLAANLFLVGVQIHLSLSNYSVGHPADKVMWAKLGKAGGKLSQLLWSEARTCLQIRKLDWGNAQQAEWVELLRSYFQVVSAGVSWKSGM